MSKYESYAVCECGAMEQNRFADTFFGTTICPGCGGDRHKRSIVILRWIWSGQVLWKPRTWFNGYWVDCDGQIFERKESP